MQLLTVTPVLPSRRMPVPEPDPVMVWPAPSRVMPSAPMMMLPMWSSVRVVSSVMVRVPVVPQTGRGKREKRRRAKTPMISLNFNL